MLQVARFVTYLMATKNTRVVGYLPPPDHQRLREYMKEQSLSESAAIVRIIQQFFDGQTHQQQVGESTAIESLAVEVALLKQRLSILEQAVASGVKGRSHSAARLNQSPPQLPPQNQTGLATRLGVHPDSITEALAKGEDEFRSWSKQKDPASRAWHKRGNLFYPVSD